MADLKVTKEIMDGYNKKRERTDKISALMGEYLLKGYCMLGACCPVCATVLLKFRDNKEFCVACCEVDVEASTDSNVPSNTTTQAVSGDRLSLPGQQQQHFKQQQTVPNTSQDARTSVKRELNLENSVEDETVCTAVKALQEKIVWASESLKASSSTEDSIRLCDLIRSSADALRSLMLLQQKRD